jgi:2-polyprenyl-3-methyl-5-hydroxy-6-metoxy-1,4-benzoquinol methylase
MAALPGSLLPDLSKRLTGAHERMDDPASDTAQLYRTLGQFRYINALLSRSRALLRSLIVPHMLQASRAVTVLDVGAGGCDIDMWLYRACRRRGIPVHIVCVDHDPRVVAYARRRIAHRHGLSIELADAREICRERRFDYVFANHFLHHVPDSQAAEMLALISGAATRGFLINDLHRDLLSYVAYTLCAAATMHNSFAFYDGRMSIRKGFRAAELRGIAREAGVDARIERRLPGRIIMYRLSAD